MKKSPMKKKSIEVAGIEWDAHDELIRCPECKHESVATVGHTVPFWWYVHDCPKCKYTIMESEWDRVAYVLDAKPTKQTSYVFDLHHDQWPQRLKLNSGVMIRGKLFMVVDIKPEFDHYRVTAIPK